MLGLLLGAGAFGFGLGAAIRMKRRLGISAEDYARQLQEFRTRHQPPPSGQGPAPYVSCVPSYPDRKAIDDLCKILDAMGRAGSLAEQEVYKDAFRTAWGKLLEGQKRCMEGWIRDSCPRLEATLAQLQAIALPPRGPRRRGMTPTRAVVPVPGGVPEFIYPSVTIPGPVPTSFVPSGMPKPGPVGPAVSVATEAAKIAPPTATRPVRPTVSVPMAPAGGGMAFTGT